MGAHRADHKFVRQVFCGRLSRPFDRWSRHSRKRFKGPAAVRLPRAASGVFGKLMPASFRTPHLALRLSGVPLLSCTQAALLPGLAPCPKHHFLDGPCYGYKASKCLDRKPSGTGEVADMLRERD
jgi:hypothetical protein